MNFIKVALKKQNDQMSIVSDHFSALLPGGKASQLEEYCDQEVIFGIRPEDIRDESIMLESYQQACFTAQVEVVELLGSEVILYLKLGEQEIVARLPARNPYKRGQTVTMVFDMNKMHVFNAVTEGTCLKT